MTANFCDAQDCRNPAALTCPECQWGACLLCAFETWRRCTGCKKYMGCQSHHTPQPADGSTWCDRCDTVYCKDCSTRRVFESCQMPDCTTQVELGCATHCIWCQKRTCGEEPCVAIGQLNLFRRLRRHHPFVLKRGDHFLLSCQECATRPSLELKALFALHHPRQSSTHSHNNQSHSRKRKRKANSAHVKMNRVL